MPFLHFGETPPPAERSSQGTSLAQREGDPVHAPKRGQGRVRMRDLKIQTTHLSARYLSGNDVSSSENALLTKYLEKKLTDRSAIPLLVLHARGERNEL